jgi:hypothetical protein
MSKGPNNNNKKTAKTAGHISETATSTQSIEKTNTRRVASKESIMHQLQDGTESTHTKNTAGINHKGA